MSPRQEKSTMLEIRKTYKLFIGGNFVRSESGRSLAHKNPKGQYVANYSHASRKDLRDAISSARTAFEKWQDRTPYLRSQILYRCAEMFQGRILEMVREICRAAAIPESEAQKECELCADRLVYYAGWADKYQQVFGATNTVASPHFNFTFPEPCGVVVAVLPARPLLLPLVSILCPVILSGNTIVLIAQGDASLPGLAFSEIVATSDIPAGVVNILTAPAPELAVHIASHMDINAVVDATGTPEVSQKLQEGTAYNMKRYTARPLDAAKWFSSEAETPYWILDTVEMKTAWHPIGL